jgi:hypothetical protein
MRVFNDLSENKENKHDTNIEENNAIHQGHPN